MRATLLGINGNDALLSVGDRGVIVNSRSMSGRSYPLDEVVNSRLWLPADSSFSEDALAEIALCVHRRATQEAVVASASPSSLARRGFTVPQAVHDEAKIGVEAARRNPRSATAAARHVGRLLASSKQVKLRDVEYIARFFNSRQQTDVTPATWSLWGGDTSRSWAQGILDRSSIAASADPEVNLLSFYDGDENERGFYAEKDEPTSEYVTGIYRQLGGPWQTWVNGDWANCDQPAGRRDGRLIGLDDDTAVYVASSLYDAPDTPVSLRDFDPEEWDIFSDGAAGIDYDMTELAMKPGIIAAGDGQYTPEERSKNAGAQLRDKNGRFASVGDSGTMKSGMAAKIKTVNPVDKTLIVEASDGNSYAVPAADFEVDNDPNVPGATGGPGSPSAVPGTAPGLPPLNLDHILGQPRATTTTPKAWMKKLLPPMGPGQLKQVVDNYSKFIEDERAKQARKFDKNNAPNFAITDKKPSPDDSDVPPLYLALVDREDPRAVTDLVALVPSDATSTQPTTFRREGGEWVEDPKVLSDLRSPTPPPTVKLDPTTYQDVLSQVDTAQPDTPADANPSSAPAAAGAPGATPAAAPAAPAAPPAAPPVQAAGDLKLNIDLEPAAIWGWDENGNICAMLAAGEGGLDRNRGNAEKLRRYWLYGKGALKIRWNTPGDWTRCVRHLEKYLGPRAKGYCALRHHEATGMWTGDRRHRQEHSLVAGGEIIKSTDEIRSKPEVIRASADAARMRAARMRVYGDQSEMQPIVTDPADITEGRSGRAFTIPLVLPEGIESGDGRTFQRGALSMRSFPLPLLWQVKTGDGHDGAFVVGRVDRVERTEDGLGNAYGVFDTGPYGAEAQRMVENKMLRWVSADLDRFEANETELADEGQDKPPKLNITKGRLMGITLVAKPAFQECTINLVPLEQLTPVPDGEYVGEPTAPEADALVASSGIAAAIPVEPPKPWFDRPLLNGPTPINVTNEGQVFGHIATWDMNHIGLPGGVRAPRSYSNYAYFHTGVVRTNEGDDVEVGQLTLAGGHASLHDDAAAAVKHYDDTGSAIADVHAGEDAYGIWVAGALRPGTTPEQVRALRASAPSGDWRVINNRHELVAVCQVNVPGFPTPRVMVASGAPNGMSALVAAGSQVLTQMRRAPLDDMSARIARLEIEENKRDEARRQAAIAKIAPTRAEREAAKKELASLVAAAQARVYKILDVDGYLTEFKDFSPEKRKELADKKHAMKDGSFPIENAADLRRAVHAHGRANDDKKAAVRRHIVRRARAINKPDMIPNDWTENSLNDLALLREDSREVIVAAALANRAEAVRKRIREV